MRNCRAEVVVLLAMVSLALMIHLSTSLAHARKPTREPAQDVTPQPSSDWEVEELAVLRQQVEDQRQLTGALQGQLEETRRTVEALTARLDARRSVEEALLGQLQDVRQEGERLRLLLYGTIGAMVVSLGLLFSLRGHFANYRIQTRRILRIPQNWSALK
jgi:septal ring factor EnvC (AmiA/AmiB activator)